MLVVMNLNGEHLLVWSFVVDAVHRRHWKPEAPVRSPPTTAAVATSEVNCLLRRSRHNRICFP
jgi:hypothetical protein